jgi:LysM repeat protein
MTAPYYPTEEDEPERPWMGMALLLSIPLLSLILVRLLWSGSDFWFLLVGILFLGVAAALFLARRNDERGPTTLADEPNRLPLALMGIGIVFVALLLLPNFSGSSEGSGPVQQVSSSSPAPTLAAVLSQPTRRPVATARATTAPTATPDTSAEVVADDPVDEADSSTDDADVVPPAGSETYVVEDGDTLWDIASSHDVTVEAIVEANGLDDSDDLQVGDELAIPPPVAASEDDSAAGSSE